jgi:two-component system, LuxR family, response regulator FixJ
MPLPRPQPRPVVVLVDDDRAVTQALQFSFDLEGLEVRGYADGESLLAGAEPPPDGCLVLDLNLPGMDGLELLERLRLRGVRTPAVLITTNPRARLKARAAAAGVPIIEKPLLTDALLTTVRRALAHGPGTAGQAAVQAIGC